MRIDKYLKVSRLIKRRTVANEVADAGRILVNGKPAKASYAVKVDDVIEITFGNKPVKVKVLSTDAHMGKDVARALGYKDTINALKSHVDEEDKKGGWRITTPSGTQEMTIINESGLYSLVLSNGL